MSKDKDSLAILQQARQKGYNATKHVLFTVGQHVLTSNYFDSIRAFTDAQKEAIMRVTESLGRKKFVQVTVLLKNK